MNNELQQEAHFGGRSHGTSHYIGMPVGPHALSNSRASPVFLPHQQAGTMRFLINLHQEKNS